jgi:hypothetical protein
MWKYDRLYAEVMAEYEALRSQIIDVLELITSDIDEAAPDAYVRSGMEMVVDYLQWLQTARMLVLDYKRCAFDWSGPALEIGDETLTNLRAMSATLLKFPGMGDDAASK